MTTLLEPIDAAPFAAWVDKQSALIVADETLWHVGRGGGAIPPDPYVILGRRIGMSEDWLRKGAWRRSGLLERAAVEDMLTRAGVLWHDVFDEDEPKRRKDLGRPWVIEERLLVLAHTMHLDGMSARAVAREIFDDCYSASPKALCNALLTAWHARGWEVRSKSEATALANVQRGFRPQCSHVSQASGRKGVRCERRCVGNDRTCWRHDPEHLAAGLARIRQDTAVA